MTTRATPSKVQSRAPDWAVGAVEAGAVGSPLQEVLGDSGAVGGCTGTLQEIPRVPVTRGRAGGGRGLITVLKSCLLTCSGVSGTSEREMQRS